MNRAVLLALLPCLVALLVALAVAVGLVRFSGARLNLRRLRELHRCQDGGVQSLAFVLTLPIFVMVSLFIVQVSQLMVGTVVVHYAAFSGARAASVWIPANVPQNPDGPEVPNRLLLQPAVTDAGERLLMVPAEPGMPGQRSASPASHKFGRIRTAAVLGCAPICPSRDIQWTSSTTTSDAREALAATQETYRRLVPGSVENARISRRLENKITYADRNTLVYVEWRDARRGSGSTQTDTLHGPTYNPADHPYASQNYERYGYKPNEVGWQDPVTVYVVHRFALLPGPGRLVADLLVRRVGVPARIRAHIPQGWANSNIAERGTYSILVPAAATITNEGLKSVRPYAQATD